METSVSGQVHTLSIRVANKPGVLMRVAQVFSRRGFNIDALVVSAEANGAFSQMTVRAKGDADQLCQITNQVERLIDVIYCRAHNQSTIIQRELAIISIQTSAAQRMDTLQLITHWDSTVLEITPTAIIAQVTGPSEKIDTLIDMLQQSSLVEVVRTGQLAISTQSHQPAS